jgi:hypothetical protein
MLEYVLYRRDGASVGRGIAEGFERVGERMRLQLQANLDDV